MQPTLTRRQFLASAAALAVAGTLPAAAPATEAIEVLWVRAERLQGARIGYAEIRFRVDHGDWEQRIFILTQESPIAWLTKDTGLDFGPSLWPPKGGCWQIEGAADAV